MVYGLWSMVKGLGFRADIVEEERDPEWEEAGRDHRVEELFFFFGFGVQGLGFRVWGL